MKFKLLLAAALMAAPALAADKSPAALSPGEIVAAAPVSEWVAIAPDDLLVMNLAPDRDGKARRVVIQLMPAPFSQPWTANIRTLAKAHWWDGLAIVRSQDNYVVQWGDPEGEDQAKAKALPGGLGATSEADYSIALTQLPRITDAPPPIRSCKAGETCGPTAAEQAYNQRSGLLRRALPRDPYAGLALFRSGWPLAAELAAAKAWPVHCYGMVGVGRGLSPDAGTGAELYTVIGHAPRHLDRNIAVVGRVIEGIEHLSTLPRGTEALGFYKTPQERTPIVSIRLAGELPEADQPHFEYLSTEGETFARYADARANRKDEFFIVPAGGADACNIPVPVRRVTANK